MTNPEIYDHPLCVDYRARILRPQKNRGAAAEDVRSLHNQITVTLERDTKLQIENATLQSRVAELKSLISDLISDQP